jgi:metal-sulfur cluster biosynthetic enzyme
VNEHNTISLTEEQIYTALRDCFDPEIPVNVVDLGLIYDVKIIEDWVGIKMTLTTPGCPASNQISQQVKDRVKQIPGVGDADVRIVWQPQWDASRMSDEAKKKLGVNKS